MMLYKIVVLGDGGVGKVSASLGGERMVTPPIAVDGLDDTALLEPLCW